MRRFLRAALWSLLFVVVSVAALIAYFLYTPDPMRPHLSGSWSREAIDVGGRKRTYLTYIPVHVASGSPLIVVLHGSGEDGARMRIATGYGFERLADENGFIVAYPDGYEGYWNACNIVGDYAANTLDINDVQFLTAMVDALVAKEHVDAARVFAMGISRGGHMAYRLALEAPTRFRAVVAVAANVPAPGNFKCKPTGGGTSSVMIMNGTLDPLNPFNGGEVRLFGLFIGRGTVLSSQQSGEYFARLNAIADPPQTSVTRLADDVRVEQSIWRGGSGAEIDLVAIDGGGHGLPQPYWRHPRILGPSPTEPNGPALIWAFFARQTPTKSSTGR